MDLGRASSDNQRSFKSFSLWRRAEQSDWSSSLFAGRRTRPGKRCAAWTRPAPGGTGCVTRGCGHVLNRGPGFPPVVRPRWRSGDAHRSTVLHCHQYSPFVYAALARVSASPPARAVHRARTIERCAAVTKRRLVNPMLARAAHRIFSVSQDLRRHMIAEGLPASRIEVIPNGIDPASPSVAAREELRASSVRPVHGRADHGRAAGPGEGPGNAVGAVGHAAGEASTCMLVVVGDGPERARSRRRRGTGAHRERDVSRAPRGRAPLVERGGCLRQQLGQRRDIAHDSRGHVGWAAGDRDRGRRHAGNRGCELRDAGAGAGPGGAERRSSHSPATPVAVAAGRQQRARGCSNRLPSIAWSTDIGGLRRGLLNVRHLRRRRPRRTARPAARRASGDGRGHGLSRPGRRRILRQRRIALGHRRLAIIDRAGGEQPMANEDGTCWIVFNGEVYNHRDLRPVLKRAATASAPSPTPRRLSTPTKNTAPAASSSSRACSHSRSPTRDATSCSSRAIGWARSRSSTRCSTACCTSPARSARWRRRRAGTATSIWLRSKVTCRSAISWRPTDLPRRPQAPGPWLHVAGGRLVTRRYWDVEEFDTDQRDEARWSTRSTSAWHGGSRAARKRSAAGRLSVGRHRLGARRVVHGRALGDRLLTATVGFGEAAHNELEAAGLTAGHFTRRTMKRRSTPKLEDVLEPVVAFGEPFADSSAIPTWYVSRSARQHVTVALTGDGGDETFGGYDFRYVPHALEGTRGPSCLALRPCAGRRRRTRVAAIAAAAEMAARRHGARESRRRLSDRLLRRPVLSEAGRHARLLGPAAARSGGQPRLCGGHGRLSPPGDAGRPCSARSTRT